MKFHTTVLAACATAFLQAASAAAPAPNLLQTARGGIPQPAAEQIPVLCEASIADAKARIEKLKVLPLAQANAKTVLLEAAQFMERQRSSNFTYAGVALPARLQISPAEGAQRYVISLVSDASSFTLTATPTGWVDAKCGALTLTNLGIKGQALGDTATCWTR